MWSTPTPRAIATPTASARRTDACSTVVCPEGSFNYVRNSVKAVVDAYDGDVAFYRMPVEDPIADAWMSAFPDLFTAFDDMPEALRDHLRYPQDLFRVQTNMWARYQVSDPESLIIGTERWDVAQNPGRQVRVAAGTETTVGEDGLLVTREERVNPYYALMELPGEDEPSFVTLRSFVPFDENDDRRELEAFMVGETRPDGTSRLVSYEITSPDAPGPFSWPRRLHRTRRSRASSLCSTATARPSSSVIC